MRTLTELSGEYVTFDQNGRKCSFEFMAADLEDIDFSRLATLFERLDES